MYEIPPLYTSALCYEIRLHNIRRPTVVPFIINEHLYDVVQDHKQGIFTI